MKKEKQMSNELEPVRVGCTIIVHRHGRVLLGERGESCETAKNLYAYPGGRMDYGETPEDGILRELFEETGLRGKKEDLKFFRYCNEFFPEQGKHYVSLVFIMELKEGEPVTTEPDKCKGWEWIEVDHLPENMFEPARESLMMAAYEILGLE
jgi:8-oxo-dGTP diphosphatase